MADSMLVEYIMPRPMTDRSSNENITRSIAIPRSRFSFEEFLMILPFKQRIGRALFSVGPTGGPVPPPYQNYWQLIGAPVAACEQLFSFTVDTRVVTGRWRVLGSIVAARK